MNAPFAGALAIWRNNRRAPIAPFVCTTLVRVDETVDVTVEFEVDHGQFWVLDAYLDAPEPGDFLTNDECERLAEWLIGEGYERALAASIN